MTDAIPKLKLVPPVPEILYCGCHEQTGHYFWTPGMRGHKLDHNYHDICKLDGCFAPKDTSKQGEAWFHSEPGYMVISFWDNSIDTRPGSNSTFLLTGAPMCFNDAIAKCRLAFPEVFARFKFQITLRRNCFLKQEELDAIEAKHASEGGR
jgi:hypothetical protein